MADVKRPGFKMRTIPGSHFSISGALIGDYRERLHVLFKQFLANFAQRS
jgi:hypothetical protein